MTTKKNKKKLYCECCGKEITVYTCRKYCSACSVSIYKYRQKIGSLKHEIKELRIKLYGQANGSERIRFKEDKKGKSDDI